MSESTGKSHYRKVFKSDHLGVADLEDFLEEGKKLIFTIKEVRQEFSVKVAGRSGDFNIAYFKEQIKPLVLNATNSKIVKGFAGGTPFVEDWKNILVELYIDPTVKMKGEIVGGVRIHAKQPVITKAELTPKHPRWEEAKKAVASGRKQGVLKQFSVSAENLKLLEG